jgi:hypothetical protein
VRVALAKVAFTSEDRVRDVIRNFNTDGFGSLYPKYKGARHYYLRSTSLWVHATLDASLG